MCMKALSSGYRHFDTASGYGNEKQVGQAIRESGIPRNEIFLTTKLANSFHGRVREAFEKSLNDLDCEYIDLYLLHWPQAARYDIPGGNAATARGGVFAPDESPTFVETWKEIEKLLDTGKVKSIGVSNFSIQNLSILLQHCKIVPAVNQVELHPCLPQHALKKFCDEKGILLTAYSPVGRMAPLLMSHPAIVAIAERTGVTPTQVVLSWAVQRGTSIVPKSENEERMRKNIDLVQLSPDDMATVDEFHKVEPGMHRSLLDYHAEDGSGVLGWKYEWLGWPMREGGYVVE